MKTTAALSMRTATFFQLISSGKNLCSAKRVPIHVARAPLKYASSPAVGLNAANPAIVVRIGMRAPAFQNVVSATPSNKTKPVRTRKMIDK